MCSEGPQPVGGRFLQPAEKCTTQKSDCDGGKQLFPKTQPRYVEHVTRITWLVLRAARGESEGRLHFLVRLMPRAVTTSTGRKAAVNLSLHLCPGVCWGCVYTGLAG